MVWIQCIYFCLIAFYFFHREKQINAAFIICIFYAFSSVMAVMIDVLNLYGDFGIDDYQYSIGGTIVYCLGLTAILFPFTKLQISEASFKLKNPRLFSAMCIVLFSCTLIYVLLNFTEIVYSLTTDAEEVKASHYDDLSSGSTSTTQNLFMYPLNILSSAWNVMLLCWFISFIFLKKGFIFNSMLLLGSFGGVLKGSLIAGRAAIIYWIFSFITLFCIFYPYFPSAKIRRRLILFVSVPFALVAIVFYSITISRFGYQGENEALYSFIGYAGQPYNNFCAVFEHSDNLPFTIERIMPVTYKYIVGGQFDLVEYYGRLAMQTGILVNNFYTLIGGLLLTTGLPFSILCICLYYLCASRVCRKLSKTMDFSYFLLVSILILVPIQGMFDVPFPYIGDTLVNIVILIFFFLFHYSFSFGKERENETAKTD